MHVINVRPETAEDIRAIDVVHISAFGGEAEAQLVSALRESTTYTRELPLVAELGGRIVGHALMTRCRCARMEPRRMFWRWGQCRWCHHKVTGASALN